MKIFNTIINALALGLEEAGVTNEVEAGEDDDYVEDVELNAESDAISLEPTEKTTEG
jgi:hypothetical protein